MNYPDAGRWRSEKLDWLLKNPDEAERLYGRLGGEAVEKALRETSEKLSRRLLRKVLGAAPFVGIVAGMYAFPGKVRAKGLNAAIVDEALEQTPVVEYLKAGVEIGTGRDTIPDWEIGLGAIHSPKRSRNSGAIGRKWKTMDACLDSDVGWKAERIAIRG